jgi:hypothetical protein
MSRFIVTAFSLDLQLLVSYILRGTANDVIVKLVILKVLHKFQRKMWLHTNTLEF